jgi:Ca-activated chloride channel family protein
LLDEIRLHGENQELKDEATELARQYGIVTPYTAYLIIEDESRRNVPESVRLMPRFYRDREARDEAAQVWQQFQKNSSGQAALADAQAGRALRSANAPSEAASESMARFRARYGLGSASGGIPAAQSASSGGVQPNSIPTTPIYTGPAQSTAGRLVQYSQQSRFVGGKTFFENENGWVDSAIQKLKGARHVRLQFGSAEYFNFLKEHPQAAPWLALGQNVQLELGNVIYEVIP